MDWFEILKETGIVPVVKIADAERAADLARALVSGGLRAAEITFRTEAAPRAIELMRRAEPELLVGAGTVLTESAAEAAARAGAQFAVAPGFRPSVAAAVRELGLPFVPGVMTPSEIEAATAEGYSLLKFFPAEAAGGVKTLKAFAGPYAGVRFMPTGGITPENAPAYLSLGNVVCCGGTYIADERSIAEGDFRAIEERARAAVRLVEETRSGS